MKNFILLLSLAAALFCRPVSAQIVLDDFTTGTQPGQGDAMGSWVGQVTQNATTLTIAGTAHDDNGWGVFNLVPFDASAMQFITITAQLDAGNTAGSFNVQFFDDNFGGQAFSISPSLFLTGVMTTVTIPIGAWSGIDPTILNAWTIGGGNVATNGPDFRMTLDQLALTPSAVPEPATNAALAGIFMLGIALWRRRRLRLIAPIAS
eukprot:gene10675-13548_t